MLKQVRYQNFSSDLGYFFCLNPNWSLHITSLWETTSFSLRNNHSALYPLAACCLHYSHFLSFMSIKTPDSSVDLGMWQLIGVWQRQGSHRELTEAEHWNQQQKLDHQKPRVPTIWLQSLSAVPESSYTTYWQYLIEAHHKFPKEQIFNRI